MLIFIKSGSNPSPPKRCHVLVDNNPKNVMSAVRWVSEGIPVGVAGEIPMLYFVLFLMRSGIPFTATNEMGIPVLQIFASDEEARSVAEANGLELLSPEKGFADPEGGETPQSVEGEKEGGEDSLIRIVNSLFDPEGRNGGKSFDDWMKDHQ